MEDRQGPLGGDGRATGAVDPALRLPDFLIVGAMKAGTTAVYDALRRHPDVFMPELKEVEFFAAERTWGRGVEWYASLFAEGHGARAVGEASTIYTKHPHFAGVPERIASVIPDVRLVYLVRDPIERIRSHYLHNVAHGRESRSLAVAVREDPIYVLTSRYATQLARFEQVFPRERLLVLTSDALRAEPAATLGRVLRHIGVDGDPASLVPGTSHATAAKRSPRPGVRLIKHSPVRRTVERVLPTPVWDAIRRTLTRPVDRTRGEVPDDLRAELAEALAPDVAGLRPYLGPGFDGWGIA